MALSFRFENRLKENFLHRRTTTAHISCRRTLPILDFLVFCSHHWTGKMWARWTILWTNIWLFSFFQEQLEKVYQDKFCFITISEQWTWGPTWWSRVFLHAKRENHFFVLLKMILRGASSWKREGEGRGQRNVESRVHEAAITCHFAEHLSSLQDVECDPSATRKHKISFVFSPHKARPH